MCAGDNCGSKWVSGVHLDGLRELVRNKFSIQW